MDSWGKPPNAVRTSPVTITLPMAIMKKYVGKAKTRPASRTPLRLP